MLNRRAMIALSGAALPFAVRAQPSEPPVAVPPEGPSAPVMPVPPPAVVPPPAPAVATGPAAAARPAPAGSIDKTKTYFVFFDQAIDVLTMRALRRQLNSLVEAGVSRIELVVSSPGGLIYQALDVYGLIRALPATINTHATGLVASAATILFLAGETRSADRNARFFFHASQGLIPGSVSSVQLQERLAQFAALNAMETQIYKDRTQLPDSQISRFDQEEVFYTPDEAREFGIVQSVADLHIPGENTSRVVFVE